MAHINYITNCNLFLVENSGNEGYFYEPEYYTTLSEARAKQAAWVAIGDTAKITVVEATARVFNEINENWGGGITSLYELVDVNGITVEEINACLNDDLYEEELPVKAHNMKKRQGQRKNENLFEEWVTNGKQGGALGMLANYRESVTV